MDSTEIMESSRKWINDYLGGAFGQAIIPDDDEKDGNEDA